MSSLSILFHVSFVLLVSIHIYTYKHGVRYRVKIQYLSKSNMSLLSVLEEGNEYLHVVFCFVLF